MTLQDSWPLFGLRITTPRLTLRLPTDADLGALLAVAKGGVHDPAHNPFFVPWTSLPSPEMEWRFLQYHWGCRATLSPDRWDLGFVVECDGVIVGSQSLHGKGFLKVPTAETGSWLGQRFQGRGIGVEMRRAILHFAFQNMRAEEITSGAFVHNLASQRVSLACGYQPNGTVLALNRDGVEEQVKFRITKAQWESARTDLEVDVSGWDESRGLLGL
jgi:RimJ/RimL family protein N-acetyltransferase